MEDLANIYHPETKSTMKTLQGIASTIQCFGGEVPFFLLSSTHYLYHILLTVETHWIITNTQLTFYCFAGFILKRVDHMNVISIILFTFALRFFLYSIIENPIWVLPIQALNGITHALSYSTIMSYVAQISPTGAEGTLQGIIGTALTGIGL